MDGIPASIRPIATAVIAIRTYLIVTKCPAE